MRHGLSRHILLAILHFFVLPLLARLVGGLLSSLLRKESPLGFWLEFGVLYLGSVLTCAFLLA
jgi:hypothetical protein